jgi:hypothetical protein
MFLHFDTEIIAFDFVYLEIAVCKEIFSDKNAELLHHLLPFSAICFKEYSI